jgi:threonine dehydrogenase-like Zn-dependent dehydrogenase
MRTSISIARPAGAVGRVGVPQNETMAASLPAFYNNVTISGGPAPVCAYIEELLPDILEGRIEPGRVFDRVSASRMCLTVTGRWTNGRRLNSWSRFKESAFE